MGYGGQEKTTSVEAASVAVGLDIHKWKSEIFRCNTACNNRFTHDGEALEDVKTFTYLGNIIDKHGESDAYVKAWMGDARTAYLQLKDKTIVCQPTLKIIITIVGSSNNNSNGNSNNDNSNSNNSDDGDSNNSNNNNHTNDK
ncbi:unnamed protein product [Schistosoma margrebowiei]|uniref:Uncharacterized protein n=1 Tax=Schistosoma margrebowiei TaxID=48269 RepID=A0A183MVE4_9TREM|nr:unnamed protein product [Schistosoma margrebowiei]